MKTYGVCSPPGSGCHTPDGTVSAAGTAASASHPASTITLRRRRALASAAKAIRKSGACSGSSWPKPRGWNSDQWSPRSPVKNKNDGVKYPAQLAAKFSTLARVESLEVVAAAVEHPGHFSM